MRIGQVTDPRGTPVDLREKCIVKSPPVAIPIDNDYAIVLAVPKVVAAVSHTPLSCFSDETAQQACLAV